MFFWGGGKGMRGLVRGVFDFRDFCEKFIVIVLVHSPITFTYPPIPTYPTNPPSPIPFPFFHSSQLSTPPISPLPLSTTHFPLSLLPSLPHTLLIRRASRPVGSFLLLLLLASHFLCTFRFTILAALQELEMANFLREQGFGLGA